jgi:spermidine/putrescine transport system ATP-binding protein
VNRIPLTANLPLASQLDAGKGTLCIRPESIGTAHAPLCLGACRIDEVTFFGTHQRALAQCADIPNLRLTFHLPQDAVVSPGETLTLFARDHVVLEA